ncbi:MAG: hypothetical protein B6I24_06105 [Bacteroidetes bacterium 4572_128]|nr:MAG: hypothetical protein B6I24_06105 [Bacteroidetes bacterium 4572_128]
MNEYNLLIQKLEFFIKKYYKNQIIKGIIFSAIIYIFIYLSVTLTEYFGHFSTKIRTFLFYSTLIIFVFVFVYYILLSILKLFKIGKTISHKQAAIIISKHFKEVEDKLLNILELANFDKNNGFSNELIIASIDQKVKLLKPIPFKSAINFKENFKYLKFLAPLIFIVFLIYFIAPNMLADGTQRIFEHQTYFKPVSPFHIKFLNDSLEVKKGKDYKTKIEITGKYIHINNEIDFYFASEKYKTESYHLNILPPPLILNFNVSVDVPNYTGEKDKILENIGDLTIPIGSKIKWNIKTLDVDSLYLEFSESKILNLKNINQSFEAFKKIIKSENYSINFYNKFFKNPEKIEYSINVVPDLYPKIVANSLIDSAVYTLHYFKGNISDDYGFKKLTFNYKEKGKKEIIEKINLRISNNTLTQEFYHTFDFSEILEKNYTEIEYYFEVFDNDGVNGSKSARTKNFTFKIPNKEELRNMENESHKNLEKKIEKSLELADELKNDLKKMKEQNINNSSTSWEKMQMMENIADKQKSLEEMLKEIAEENQNKNDMKKTLLAEIEKLKEKFNEKDFNKLFEKMEMSYDDLEEQLDRNLEVLKKFELEEKLNQSIEDLKELAKEQKQLSKDVKEKNLDREIELKKQKDQKKKFEKIKEDYKKAQELNKELEDKMDLKDFEKEEKEIDEQFEKTEEKMEKNRRKKSSKMQKENSEKMESLAMKMQKMMDENMQEETGEDIDALRQILDNLVSFSFSQEELMNNLKNMKRGNPAYVEITQKQKDLTDDFKIIKDSLQALAKRTPQLSSIVSKELLLIENYASKAIETLGGRDIYSTRSKFSEERYKQKVATSQQMVMTSANNLALLLDEVLKSMQEQMSNCSGGSCSKKGKGKSSKPSMSSMKQMQKDLKKQLENMLKEMKNGNQKGGKKGGSKELAKMLAEQEKFKQMMNEFGGSALNPETQKKLNDIKKMVEESEKEIANKMVSIKTLERQKKIMTRLLEAEKSEEEREIEEKRESKEANKIFYKNPEELFKEKKLDLPFKEILNTNNLKLDNYYKKKYKEYLLNLMED